MSERVPVHEMLHDLRFVKLSKKDRADLGVVKHLLESRGSLPSGLVASVRRLYSRNAKKIRVSKEARERGKASMALQTMSLSKNEVEKIREERLEDLHKKLTDLGF